MFIVSIISLIGFLVFLGSVKFISRHDSNNFEVSRKSIIFMYIFAPVYLIYLKYGNSFSFSAYSILVIYLVIVGFIDYRSKNVYSIFNWVMYFIGSLSYIILIFLGYNSVESLLYNILFIAFVKILGFLNMFGDGDVDILIVISLILGVTLGGIYSLVILLLLMIISNLVALILNIRLFNFKKLIFKEEIAYVFILLVS